MANQMRTFMRTFADITENVQGLPGTTGKDGTLVKPVGALSNAYNALVHTAKKWAKDNQSARVLPAQSKRPDGSRTTSIEFTGENADELFSALQVALNDAVSQRDADTFASALSIRRREQRYNAIRATLDKRFFAKFGSRLKEGNAEVTNLNEKGLVEIAVPEGATWSGAGKNHTRRVDAWSSLKRAVTREQSEKAQQRANDEQFLTSAGIDPAVFEQMLPGEKKSVLSMASKTHKNRTVASQKGAREALIDSEIAKSAALRSSLDARVFASPLLPLPDAEIRKLSPEASSYRRLYRRAEDQEQKLRSPEELYKLYAGQAKEKELKQSFKERYIKENPGSLLARAEALRLQKVTNREEKQRVLEAEQVPGSKAFRDKVSRTIRADEARKEAVKEYIRGHPFSSIAVADRRKQRSLRERKQALRKGRTKRAVNKAARFVRSTLTSTVGLILAGITVGIGLLAKSYQIITQIGSDIRKRAVNEARFNFEPDTVRQFELFAGQHVGLKNQKDLLVRAAGGIQEAWSTPLDYTDGGFNQLAPYLREGTVKLVRMATPDGDANVLKIMSSVVDDLVDKSISGISGAKTFNPGTKDGAAPGVFR
jgi:hypothetical protein